MFNNPDRQAWILARYLPTGLVMFLFWTILRPGLPFWPELTVVIPFMLMGGMCSEDMMQKMIMTAGNIFWLGLATSIWLGARDHVSRIYGQIPSSRLWREELRPTAPWDYRISRLRHQ